MASFPSPCPPDVLISEVGPRDGLQSVKTTMPTADKLRWSDALQAAGVREIEVASFVPAKLLPQREEMVEEVRAISELHRELAPRVRLEASISTAFGCTLQGLVPEDTPRSATRPAPPMHNTRGLGLAHCLAAYEEGVRTFDASLGGLGGCPYAPGATGNVVTEDPGGHSRLWALPSTSTSCLRHARR